MALKARTGVTLELEAEGEGAEAARRRPRGAGRARLRRGPWLRRVLTRPAGLARPRDRAAGPARRCGERRRRSRPGARRRSRPASLPRRRAGEGRARRARRAAVPRTRAPILEFQLGAARRPGADRPGGRGDRARQARGTRRGGALDAEIAGYEAAEDEYFRARAADLERREGAASSPRSPAAGPTDGAAARRHRASASDLAPSRFLALDWPAGWAGLRSRPAVRLATWRCWPAPAACRWYRLGRGAGGRGGGGARRRGRPARS